jgi:GR25 family glycosyltransferase involved in LPS biosynthesis
MQKQLKEFDLSTYERFEALDGKELDRRFPTKLDSGSLGCGFSHKGVLEKNLDSDFHLHIIEDDVILHKYLPNTFDGIKDKIEWDIIYTDIYFSLLSPVNFYQLNEKQKLYKEKSELSVLNLKGIEFSGASSYFVNKKSIKKLNDYLSGDWYKHSKHDTYINTLVQKGELKAFVIVPFVSTLSKHSIKSTIDEKYSLNMLAMDTLREAFYIDASLKDISKKIDNIASSQMIDIYTKSTKILLDNLDKKIDTKTICLS